MSYSRQPHLIERTAVSRFCSLGFILGMLFLFPYFLLFLSCVVFVVGFSVVVVVVFVMYLMLSL